MHQPRRRRFKTARQTRRHAFTLVEMLVSTVLIVIMMGMFATIFQLAAGAIGTQRGIATNDQRARTLVTILRNDLRNRTFKRLIPYLAGEQAPGTAPLMSSPLQFTLRQGYFYISENDVYNDADDVLQFTVDVGADGNLFYGAAFPLGDLLSLDINQNQPDWDDGQDLNRTGTSPAAEVSYFLRNGNLYRRVLLLREPLDAGFDEQPTDDAIATPPTDEFFQPGYTGLYLYPAGYITAVGFDPAAVTFWNDFDYSAHFDAVAGLRFHDATTSLDNDPANGAPFPLGIPTFRFGHNHVTGQPREFVDDLGADRTLGGGDDVLNSLFIGRFTHEETSHRFFQYPAGTSQNDTAVLINGGNPMDFAAADHLLTLSNDGVVVGSGDDDTVEAATLQDPYNPAGDDPSFALGAHGVGAGGGNNIGVRRSEDILLTNVHSFDIKIWDDSTGDFVDIGHADFGNGDFDISENAQRTYGPRGLTAAGPLAAIGVAGDGADGQPGFALRDDDQSTVVDTDGAVFFGPDGLPGVGGVDDDGDTMVDELDGSEDLWPGSDDTTERGFPGSDDIVNRVFDTWHPDFDFDGVAGADPPPYAPGDGIAQYFPGADGAPGFLGIDDDGDTVIDNAGELGTTGSDDTPDIWHMLGPDGIPGEVGVDDDGNGITDFWVGDDGAPGVAGVDDDGDTVIDNAGELGFVGSDDVDLPEYAAPLSDDFIGVRAIRITIRYHDRKSDQLRQMTLEQALLGE